MSLIEVDSASFTYPGGARPAVDTVSFCVEKGEYLAIVGANGSGKSTLLRLINGLRVPEKGSIKVSGLSAFDPANALAVRSAFCLVFQAPFDQIVSSVVEEDVAFGPENLGLPRSEIGSRIEEALDIVGLTEERCRPTFFLSAGQQQRLAIAGALAMRPSCIAFDEATAMLDPPARTVILGLMDELAGRGIAVIHVTHDMSEAMRAGRVILMDEGRVVYDGNPAAICEEASFAFPSGSWEPALPSAMRLARKLGLAPRARESAEEIAARIAAGLRTGRLRIRDPELPPAEGALARESVIALESVGYSYLHGTVNERKAISGISFEVPRSAVVALVGRTGSGKSTVLQLANSLATASEGRVLSFGKDPAQPGADLRALRMRAPLAIQRPESALFELHAADDVAYGPRNQGLEGMNLVARVRTSMERVGLEYEQYRDRRSRSLSGGEKRRLALAGVLALEPEALLLDEPTQALDPPAKLAVLELIHSMAREGTTVVMSTHSMEEAASADLVGVLVGGRLAAFGPPAEVFGAEYDASWGIGRPFACEVALALGREGFSLVALPLDMDELADAIMAFGGGS